MTKQEYDAAIKIRRAYQSYSLRATIAARIMNRVQIKYGKERLKSSILKSLHIADFALQDVETGSFKEVQIKDDSNSSAKPYSDIKFNQILQGLTPSEAVLVEQRDTIQTNDIGEKFEYTNDQVRFSCDFTPEQMLQQQNMAVTPEPNSSVDVNRRYSDINAFKAK